MKKITPTIALFSLLTIFLSVNTASAQCNRAVDVSDSLEVIKLVGWAQQRPMRNWDNVKLVDTLGTCRVEGVRSNSVNFLGSDGIFNLPYLKNLSIINPNMEDINSIAYEHMPILETLYFRGFNCDAEIPDLNIPLLKELYLNDNCFSGNIPNFQHLPNLRVLRLEENALTGTIPNFDKIPFLEEAWFSYNQLTGNVPNFQYCPLLTTLNVCNIPNVITAWPELNDYIGPIPTFENSPLLNTNDINFTCVRPGPPIVNCEVSQNDSLELVNFYNETNGDNWLVNTGWLNGNLTSWWGVELVDTLGKCRVKKIFLRGINDAVNLPELNLPFLEELILDYNNFTGDLPGFSNLTNLKILNLGENNFTGDLPNLNSLTKLEEINLNQNLLTDEITGFSNQPNLKILDLSFNQLIGSVPGFSNNINLQELNLSGNLLSGSIPDFQSIPNLNYLNVSGNELTGSIPDFSNLVNLYTLDIAMNQLTGGLPNFTNLPVMQSLFVNDNLLSGRIPNFNNLILLEELVVCDNNFEGTAPNFSLSPSLNVDGIDFSCLQAAKARGFVYYDANSNCVFDEDDITIPNGFVSINNGANFQPIDENGYYEIALEVGTSVITFIQTSPLWEPICEDTYTITSTSINDITELHFANEAYIDCTELTVDIGTNLLRRCFKNTYFVQYCNQGTETATDAYIEIDFDEKIVPLSASLPYNETDNLLTFQIGDVGIGECGSFTVVDSVSCTAPLSSTGCVEAHIYPDGYCAIPSSIWDGANLSANAFCLNNDSVQFIIENLGEDMADLSNYKIYEVDAIAVHGEFILAGGASKTLEYPATGTTYRLVVEQTPGHPSQSDVQAYFEFCGEDNFSTGYINSQLLPDADAFLDIDCEEIIGSYDPNDKQVNPTGVGETNDIYKNNPLTYKIRFQNVGNDTAFTVMIVDTLDFEHLNTSSLEVLNSSHPYTLSIKDGHILTVNFDNILLVDSTTNEAASHGFIKFQVKQLKNNIGDVIENKAYIYFDYNLPIETPLVFNTLAEPQLTPDYQFLPLTSIDIYQENMPVSKVYPNPVSDKLFVDLPEQTMALLNKPILHIYYTQGQLNSTTVLKNYTNTIDVSDLSHGIYFYKLISDNTTISGGKIIKQ